MHSPFTYVDIINKNATALDIVKAIKQFADRRFSRAGCADKRDLLSWFYGKRDVTEHPIFTFISEPHMVERDTSLQTRATVGRHRRRNSNFSVKQLKHSLHRRHRRLHRCIFSAEFTQRDKKLL